MSSEQIKIKAIITGASGESIDISDFVGDISVAGALKESTRTLDFKALRGDVDKTMPAYNVDLGAAVAFYEKAYEQKSFVKFYEGVIWSKSVKDNSVDVDISCYDKAIYLNKNQPETQVFNKKTAKEVATTVISELGLTPGKLADTGIDDYNLRDKTGYDAIMEAYKKDSEKTGKVYKLVDIDGVINVFEAGDMVDVVIEEKNEPVVGKLLDTSYRESLDDLVNEVKALEDEKKDEKKDGGSDKASQERFGKIQKVLKGDSSEVAGLMKGAKQEVEVKCIGNWDMVSGKSIMLKSSIVSGKFYIESDKHYLDDAVHTVDLKLVSEF
ncbi:hypothetical protein NH286_03175 [Anaerococcus sp. NML200574]|uniref:XkdQ/YqbQ family protein n=1 Tax=Anaerococcus sp. NML200574 TaxID=2954486 RepID=UPI0022391027|nr:hypothetical protein [Anaerococcus sp. NML200574]MCW6678155.1 hypothetical protein [Anaerococcus sp. NML200574]